MPNERVVEVDEFVTENADCEVLAYTTDETGWRMALDKLAKLVENL